MVKKTDSKLKILYLLEILYKYTDQAHTITMSQIIEHLNKKGISAERKSLYSDIETLKEFGIPIVKEKRGNYCYYVENRVFSLGDIRTICDCICSCKNISDDKCASLLRKVKKLISEEEAKKITRRTYVTDRIKSFGENVRNNLNIINRAFEKKCKLSFRCYEYTVQKKKEFINNGEFIVASPYFITVKNDLYYLMARPTFKDTVCVYRIDRMIDVTLSKEVITKSESEDNSLFSEEAICNSFGVRLPTEKVKLICENKCINEIIDKFGDDIEIEEINDEKFEATVFMNTDTEFYGWIFSKQGGVLISSPKSVAKKFSKMIKKFGGK